MTSPALPEHTRSKEWKSTVRVAHLKLQLSLTVHRVAEEAEQAGETLTQEEIALAYTECAYRSIQHINRQDR